ncbi:putative arabinan endo-1,5-alpha-L-arabinosidase A [Teratosphaeria destructans]|uniref:Endo-1,5-alpha-L-arabinanase A n=1 Tax=Teratosphaeria destructans TaxID=418781 RepID=A0A9W7SX92_9PEZI|nr:putative arabinan endo-1,5-alpha-L-arabinosidase A [Teratosphaeria destructans]
MALKGTEDMWAPDVHFGGDTYYLYYAVSSFGTQNSFIGVATSKTMEPGSWTDHGSTGITSETGDNFNAIDPNFIRVRGVNFLTFGSFWKGIHQTTLSADALTGPDTTPYPVESEPKRGYATEGSYVYAHGGYYYLFFSEGQCCGYDKHRPPPGGEYKIKVCRSKAVNGGFVDQSGVSCQDGGGTLVLGSHGNVYGPGGQGVYDDPTEGPVLYYHYVDTNYGYGDGSKFLGVNRIDFSTGWPVV